MTALRLFVVMYATVSAALASGWSHGRFEDPGLLGLIDSALVLAWAALVVVAWRIR